MKSLQLRLSFETLRILQEEQTAHVNGACSVTAECTSGAVSCVVTPKGCKQAF